MKEVNEIAHEMGLTRVQYLGDSVYVGEAPEGGVWLLTWNGYANESRNKIYLGPVELAILDLWRGVA